MSTEEPAWKAELREELRIALGASDIENIYVRRRAHDAVFPSMVEAIQAAEQRGRREALEQAAYEFSEDASRARGTEPRRAEILGGVAYILRVSAESS